MTTANFYQIDNFLGARLNRQLLDFATDRELDFVDTTTTTNANDYRKSKVLYNFAEYFAPLELKLRSLLPIICGKLRIASFDIVTIESQLTAHNHGHYYKSHTDNGCAATKTRRLTYVYYFHSQPSAFTGGQLELGDTQIDPENDRLICFPSGDLHQVLTIDCPHRKFTDSRFTINGWIRA